MRCCPNVPGSCAMRRSMSQQFPLPNDAKYNLEQSVAVLYYGLCSSLIRNVWMPLHFKCACIYGTSHSTMK